MVAGTHDGAFVRKTTAYGATVRPQSNRFFFGGIKQLVMEDPTVSLFVYFTGLFAPSSSHKIVEHCRAT